ncbi:MAG: alpha-N-arabinofuranosidase, partial [Treponema sp.]|nr:alpha-N-arabinofuranosidase [Treponema sp.]
YYFTYSTGDTHNICWATSDNVYGPYTYGGILLMPVIGWTNHHYCVEFRGKWYLFYHDCERSKGVNHQRDVKFCSLNFNEDGSIQTVTP